MVKGNLYLENSMEQSRTIGDNESVVADADFLTTRCGAGPDTDL